MKAKLFLSLALVGALCCSCSSFDDINDNPNDPTVVSPKLIFRMSARVLSLAAPEVCMLIRW